MCPASSKHPVWPCCLAEISNLLVVTKDRVLTHPSPMPDSQLSFHRILKEDIEQVQPPISSSISHLHLSRASLGYAFTVDITLS